MWRPWSGRPESWNWNLLICITTFIPMRNGRTGRGTPGTDLDKEKVEREAEERKESSGKKRILVVDDNGTTLRTMKAMLEDQYEVSIAVSGAQAMTSIGKKRPDLILLDYEMLSSRVPMVRTGIWL